MAIREGSARDRAYDRIEQNLLERGFGSSQPINLDPIKQEIADNRLLIDELDAYVRTPGDELNTAMHLIAENRIEQALKPLATAIDTNTDDIASLDQDLAQLQETVDNWTDEHRTQEEIADWINQGGTLQDAIDIFVGQRYIRPSWINTRVEPGQFFDTKISEMGYLKTIPPIPNQDIIDAMQPTIDGLENQITTISQSGVSEQTLADWINQGGTFQTALDNRTIFTETHDRAIANQNQLATIQAQLDDWITNNLGETIINNTVPPLISNYISTNLDPGALFDTRLQNLGFAKTDDVDQEFNTFEADIKAWTDAEILEALQGIQDQTPIIARNDINSGAGILIPAISNKLETLPDPFIRASDIPQNNVLTEAQIAGFVDTGGMLANAIENRMIAETFLQEADLLEYDTNNNLVLKEALINQQGLLNLDFIQKADLPAFLQGIPDPFIRASDIPSTNVLTEAQIAGFIDGTGGTGILTDSVAGLNLDILENDSRTETIADDHTSRLGRGIRNGALDLIENDSRVRDTANMQTKMLGVGVRNNVVATMNAQALPQNHQFQSPRLNLDGTWDNNNDTELNKAIYRGIWTPGIGMGGTDLDGLQLGYVLRRLNDKIDAIPTPEEIEDKLAVRTVKFTHNTGGQATNFEMEGIGTDGINWSKSWIRVSWEQLPITSSVWNMATPELTIIQDRAGNTWERGIDTNLKPQDLTGKLIKIGLDTNWSSYNQMFTVPLEGAIAVGDPGALLDATVARTRASGIGSQLGLGIRDNLRERFEFGGIRDYFLGIRDKFQNRGDGTSLGERMQQRKDNMKNFIDAEKNLREMVKSAESQWGINYREAMQLYNEGFEDLRNKRRDGGNWQWHWEGKNLFGVVIWTWDTPSVNFATGDEQIEDELAIGFDQIGNAADQIGRNPEWEWWT